MPAPVAEELFKFFVTLRPLIVISKMYIQYNVKEKKKNKANFYKFCM